ncbi:hypothetical protein T12_9980 [Trichinella patagoniensis]|uniref:Uncharacterized protein n=1 Tax=Trichinella patagoniensis TaxID=990121 RepID=A0A0V0ZRY0_9BILA|nr:hypothetical protein T12_9980 [Trichinella patagoniensis]
MYQRRWEGYATAFTLTNSNFNNLSTHYSDDECMFVVQRNTSDCKRLATVKVFLSEQFIFA